MFALFSTYGNVILFRFEDFEARPCFLEALREESGSQLDVGAGKKIRHLSALSEGCNRAKSRSREGSQGFFKLTAN